MLRCCCFLFLLVPVSLVEADQRVPWTASRITGSPEPAPPWHVQRVFPSLQFDQPVELLPLPESDRLMLMELSGRIYTFEARADVSSADLALDMKAAGIKMQRALGFGVHPDYARNRQIFVVYADGEVGDADGTRLSRFTVSETSPPQIDPASEQILLSWPSGGHNGSAIRFDSQGYLYFSTGDGARPYPPDEYDVSQDLSDLRSTICRIDVDRSEDGKHYAVPADNPFVDLPGARAEIWAYGFRNPWRFAIDTNTDRLLCGDVGWELWELIFDVKRGGNYGWSLYEGPQPIRSDLERGPTPISKPLVAYPHSVGQSVTGGIVYRGDAFSELEGAFLYGDYVTGLLWAVRAEDNAVRWNPLIAETGLRIITIAASHDNEPLLVDYDGGIYRLIRNPLADKPSRFPRKLSETGLFSSTVSLEPEAGVVLYQLLAESYRHGATTDFMLAVPGNETIKIHRQQRNWSYPTGTVFANTLSLPSDGTPSAKTRRVETQILHFDGMSWQPYSYRWNEQQTDAVLVEEAGEQVALESADTTWTIHARTECRACHSRQNGGAVGFSLENLSPESVRSLVDLGLIDREAPRGWNLEQMVDPHDVTAPLDQRARSYLAANCGHCHRRGGGGTVPLELNYAVATDQTNAIGVPPMQGDFGIRHPQVIFPGRPERSVLFYRMATSGFGHMPKLWTRPNDLHGLRLVRDWIAAMPGGALDNRLSGDKAQGADTADSLQIFAHLLDRSHTPAMRRQIAMEYQNGKSEPLITALFERFLPKEMRRKRLGSSIDPEQILAMEGDASRGRQWFFSAQLGQCVHCHRVGGSGKSVGPDLDGIGGKRTRGQLLESILDPSREIEPAYQSHLVLTDDGVIHTGLKVEQSPQALVLRSADGKDQRIERRSIESARTQSQSLMPTGLAAEMTAQELADLIAFLASLK